MKNRAEYLNLGGNSYISGNDIIGIFDLDHCTVSKKGREYLEKVQKNDAIIYESTELPKSFIIKRNNVVVLSQYNTSTIIQRERIINV